MPVTGCHIWLRPPTQACCWTITPAEAALSPPAAVRQKPVGFAEIAYSGPGSITTVVVAVAVWPAPSATATEIVFRPNLPIMIGTLRLVAGSGAGGFSVQGAGTGTGARWPGPGLVAVNRPAPASPPVTVPLGSASA